MSSMRIEYGSCCAFFRITRFSIANLLYVKCPGNRPFTEDTLQQKVDARQHQAAFRLKHQFPLPPRLPPPRPPALLGHKNHLSSRSRTTKFPNLPIASCMSFTDTNYDISI